MTTTRAFFASSAFAVASLDACLVHAADCAPSGMVHIVTTNVSPGVAENSFAAQPVVVYRAGRTKARLEEASDPAKRTHSLFVTSAPDAWIVNLFDGTGTHVVDGDKPPRVTLPLFSPGEMPLDFPVDFTKLEYGCESDFFEANKASLLPYTAGNRELSKHQVSSGAWRLTLVTDKGSATPQALLLSKNDKVVYAIRYELFERNSKVDASLFQKPAGIPFTN